MNITELWFKALEALTNDEDELWTADTVFTGDATQTGKIAREMMTKCGLPYWQVEKTLKRLIERKVLLKPGLGRYTPNLLLLVEKMMELLEG